MNALRTATEIYQALGSNYSRLKNLYDIKKLERRKTDNMRQQLQPKKCAACGRIPPEVSKLQRAHISPLQECATTIPDNLILLCTRRKDDPQPGCHTLYDQGYCSIENMRKCRKRWVEAKSPITRKHMLQLRADFGQCSQQQGHLRKELNSLKKQQESIPANSESWNSLQIQIAEVTRRPARKDTLKGAWNEIIKLQPKNLQTDLLKTRYFYEKAYIELLSGRLDDALSDFLEGREILEPNITRAENRWRWAAHTALSAQVGRIMYFSGTENGWSWDKIRGELMQALNYAQKAAIYFEGQIDAGASLKDEEKYLRDEYRHARRWVHNCLVHLIKPELAQGKLEAARKRWKKADDNWQSMDISIGWDAGFRTNHLSLCGQIKLKSAQSPEEIDEALKYLIRSLVRFRLLYQQPEGIRDLLFCIADALERKNDPKYKDIYTVASNCVDFSSWFNPYVPRPLVVRKQ